MKEGALKVAALFSYCGGPLFIAGILKPHMRLGPAFLITFLPVACMVVGALCLAETRNRWTFAAVCAGRQGLYIVLGMHVYALWCFLDGVRVPDQALHYIGLAVGAAWSTFYLRASRRWLQSTGGSSRAGDPDSTESIEPS
jgi:hypothetical protein